MSDPDYIVLYPAEGQSSAGMPGDMFGRWYDRRYFLAPQPKWLIPHGTATASPSGRFEQRDDGAVAEVWTVSWP